MVSKMYGSGFGDFNRIRVLTAGTATITARQPGNATYAPAIPVTTQLTVGKLDQTIAFGLLPNKSIGDFDFDPGAIASSGLPVTYVSSNPSVATVEGVTPGSQKIKIRATGATTITASQPGNPSYHAVRSEPASS